MGGVLDGIVAVATVDSEFTSMQRVGVRNRLFWHVSDIRGRWTESVGDDINRIEGERCSKKKGTRQQQVAPFWKDVVVTTHQCLEVKVTYMRNCNKAVTKSTFMIQ